LFRFKIDLDDMPKSPSSVGVGLANWKIGEIGLRHGADLENNDDNYVASRNTIMDLPIHEFHISSNPFLYLSADLLT
jgi:hypothetical protein